MIIVPIKMSLSDRVFGCHLLTLCKREGTTVPTFVKICLEAVEKRGTKAEIKKRNTHSNDTL